MERTQSTGPISAERAFNYSSTGPNLRAAGVDYDVRVHTPYSSYEDFQFNVPIGTTGDNFDRWQVRNEEMWESLSIIEQAYRKVKEFKGADAEVFQQVGAHRLRPVRHRSFFVGALGVCVGH